MTEGMVIITDTAEIDGLVAGFDNAATKLGAAARDLNTARARLLFAPDVPDGSRQAALLAVGSALGQVESVRARALERAAALRLASSDYEVAESSPIPPLPTIAGFTLPAGTVPGATIGSAIFGALAGAVTGNPIFPMSRVGQVTSMLPLHKVAAFTQLFHSLLPEEDPMARAARNIDMQEPSGPLAHASADGLTDLADRVRLANEEAGDAEAVVDIQKIEHVDGTTSWTVAVHGTKSGDLTQPFSYGSNIDAYTGAPSSGQDLVIAAMEQAGIPPGEEVVLAAHSQAGMVAIQMANSPAVRERFSVAAVVTFGSPVSHMPAPPGVPVLNVQHAEDGVAGLSGSPGAREGGAAPDEVVVVRELSADPNQPTGGGEPHNMDTYKDTAEMVETSGAPQLEDWEKDTAHLFAEDGATVTAQTYRGARTPAAIALEAMMPANPFS